MYIHHPLHLACERVNKLHESLKGAYINIAKDLQSGLSIVSINIAIQCIFRSRHLSNSMHDEFVRTIKNCASQTLFICWPRPAPPCAFCSCTTYSIVLYYGNPNNMIKLQNSNSNVQNCKLKGAKIQRSLILQNFNIAVFHQSINN